MSGVNNAGSDKREGCTVIVVPVVGTGDDEKVEGVQDRGESPLVRFVVKYLRYLANVVGYGSKDDN